MNAERFEQHVDDLLAAHERLARFHATKFGSYGPTYGDRDEQVIGASHAIERQLKWNVRQAGLRAAACLK